MSNDGKNYETFVKQLQQALLDSEDICKQKNITIEANKKIIDNCGIEREFDLYWEYELGGITYKTIIECKDYTYAVSIEKIDALIGKTKDLPDLKAVFATKTGYQSGAKIKAQNNKIDLLIVREQRDDDWIDEDGTPYLKGIDIEVVVNHAATITSFKPVADGNWVKQNSDLDITKPIPLRGRNDQIFIEDIKTSEKYSLKELQGRLAAEAKGIPGTYSKSFECDDRYLVWDDHKLRLSSLHIGYEIGHPISLPISIDYSKELKGVIEYLHKDTTTAIFTDKIVKDW